MNIRDFFKKIKKYYNNAILCIKYPFLYPRNRFTGLYYNNRYIYNKINDLKDTFVKSLYVEIINEDEYTKDINNSNPIKKRKQKNNVNYIKSYTKEIYKKNIGILLQYKNNEGILYIIIYKNRKIFQDINNISKSNIIKIYKIDMSKYVNNLDSIIDIYFCTKQITVNNLNIRKHENIKVIIKNNTEYKRTYYGNEILLLNNTVNIYIKCLEYINKFLNMFFIFPSYTELDAMDKGWKMKFGIDICKEIKYALLHTYTKSINNKYSLDYIKAYIKGIRFLYNYRIEQIKEKWGRLCWYDNVSTEDIFNIIQKYENISAKTCIVCGKPATYISKGWICPYCDDHIKDKDYAIKLKNS